MDDFDLQLAELAEEFELLEQDALDAIEETAKEVSEEGRANIKDVGGYQDQSGKYRKGFGLEHERNYREAKSTLYNKEWRLTHLLEDGHMTRDGTTRTQAFPHWEQTERFMKGEFESRLERRLDEL